MSTAERLKRHVGAGTILRAGGGRARMAGSTSGARRVSPRGEAEPDTTVYSGRVAERIRQLRKSKFGRVDDFVAKLEALRNRAVAGNAPKHLTAALLELPPETKKLNVRVRHYESHRADLPPDLYPVWAQILGVSLAEMLPDK